MTTAIEQLDTNFAPAEVADGLAWYDIRPLGVEGQGWRDTAAPFDRLPARARGSVRDPVWQLSQHSAGLCVRFRTDATAISARWRLRFESLAMPHMPASGVSGLDLYARHQGQWAWAGLGVPQQFPDNTAVLTSGLEAVPVEGPGGGREFLLYLPLYNGVDSVAIGLPPEAKLLAAPPRPGARGRGVVVYGTSIVQGGCASRAGMGYPEIMARALDCHVVNLGFSGNGPMELELAGLLAELDPAVYVLDCLPNMGADQVAQRTEPFVHILREARPDAPIVLVENITYQRASLQPAEAHTHALKNRALRSAFKRLTRAGVPGLHYVKGARLLGDPRRPADNVGTVDGTHPTDVGFLRLAAEIGKTAGKFLE